MIATGAAAHSDHGRDIAETLYLVGTGKTKDYAIADPEKLQRICKEYGIKTDGKKPEQLAAELGGAMLDEYGMRKNTLQFLNRAPKATREIWDKLGISPGALTVKWWTPCTASRWVSALIMSISCSRDCAPRSRMAGADR